MPIYNIMRQGHMIIAKGFCIVHAGKCEKLNQEIRCNTDGHNYIQAMAHTKIVTGFLELMHDREYTPDGPTVYCMDCQENCAHKGMEDK